MKGAPAQHVCLVKVSSECLIIKAPPILQVIIIILLYTIAALLYTLPFAMACRR